MPVLNITSPEEDVSLPKELPSIVVPSASISFPLVRVGVVLEFIGTNILKKVDEI